MKTKVSRFAVALLLAAPALFAQQEKPPAPAQPKNFALPEVRKFELPNGLRVRLVNYGNTPKVSMRVATLAGRINEPAEQTWLSELTASMMQEGTATRSAQQVALDAARMGGSVSVYASPNVTQADGDSLSEFAPEMMRLLAEVVRNPLMPESELARVRGDLARELSIARSQPQTIAGEKFAQVLYPDHPYGRLYPTEQSLAALTIDQVRQFHAQNFNAARTVVYAVGKLNVGAMEEAIRASFGDWKGGERFAAQPYNAHRGRGLHVIDRPGSVQSTIMLGLPVQLPTSSDWVAQDVTNTLLGGYFSSRITANIREAKGYTYSPFSTVQTRQQAAHWYELADVTTNVTGAALKEIFAEIERLQNEPPPAQELRAVQSYLAGNFVLRNSSRGGIRNLLSFVDLHGMPEDYLARYVERVYAITPAEVQRIAQQYLDESKMTIVVAGDRKQIDEQLKPYGPALQ